MTDCRVPLDRPWADQWLRLIDARFGEPLTRVESRRREVIRILSSMPDGRATFDEIAALTPALARTYARKSPLAITHDLRALMMMGLIEVPETNVVRTMAFKLFEPKPPPRPSAAERDLLTSVLRDAAPHLLDVVERLHEGERISPREQLEVANALTGAAGRSGFDKRGAISKGDSIFNLLRLLETDE
jgi:hypothetical protein